MFYDFCRLSDMILASTVNSNVYFQPSGGLDFLITYDICNSHITAWLLPHQQKDEIYPLGRLIKVGI